MFEDRIWAKCIAKIVFEKEMLGTIKYMRIQSGVVSTKRIFRNVVALGQMSLTVSPIRHCISTAPTNKLLGKPQAATKKDDHVLGEHKESLLHDLRTRRCWWRTPREAHIDFDASGAGVHCHGLTARLLLIAGVSLQQE